MCYVYICIKIFFSPNSLLIWPIARPHVCGSRHRQHSWQVSPPLAELGATLYGSSWGTSLSGTQNCPLSSNCKEELGWQPLAGVHVPTPLLAQCSPASVRSKPGVMNKQETICQGWGLLCCLLLWRCSLTSEEPEHAGREGAGLPLWMAASP